MTFSHDSVISDVSTTFACRDVQIRQLAYLLTGPDPSPSNVILYGLEATGKSSIVHRLLESAVTPYTTVKSQECVTNRHFLETTAAACASAIITLSGDKKDYSRYVRCESISALANSLQRILEGCKKFVLVLDGVDRQREAPPTLLPALARLGEIIPCLTVAFIVTSPRPRFLLYSGVPHVHFPSYSREEVLHIISLRIPSILDESQSLSEDPTVTADTEWLWGQYCAALWDSLGKGAARDVVSFRNLAEKLWNPFTEPIRDGKYGLRDFSRLVVGNRGLFQSEQKLIEKIVPEQELETTETSIRVIHDLPYFSKYLICASYLASYNAQRLDQTFFMKAFEKKRKKKKASANPGKVRKYRKIPRRLLSPSSFTLERLLAIFHAIIPHNVVSTADLYTQVATLTSLRLFSRTSGIGAGDVLDGGPKWKTNVGWDYVVAVARSVGFEIEEWVADD